MPAPEQPYTSSGFAIINPYGGIWTDKVFATEKEALKYLRDYWGEARELNEFKLAYAHLKVETEGKRQNGRREDFLGNRALHQQRAFLLVIRRPRQVLSGRLEPIDCRCDQVF